MNFDQAFERLIGHEGGYVNHPSDPGGETMHGITRRVAVSNGYNGKMIDLSLDMAKDIAKREYWIPCKADSFDGAIAFQLFDIAYNHGVSVSAKLLQRAVGVADDGIIGPATIAATKKLDEMVVICLINAKRIRFYTSLSTWPTFGKGWANRVAGNLEYGAIDK